MDIISTVLSMTGWWSRWC